MANQPINLFGGFYRDPNLPWSSQDCLNFLVVPSESSGTRTGSQLREFGRKPFVQITKRVGEDVVDAGPIRGQRNVEGKLFVVAGTILFQISNTGVAIPYGTIPGVGRVSMTHNQRGNGNELKIVNGSAGYVFNTSTLLFQKITDEGYPGEVVTDFIDGYVAGVETQGRFWEHSELADALNYNTLDRYEAEGFPDRIVTLIVSHREVLVFGSDSIEPYVNTGGTTGTFERAANTVIEGGCAARFSPKKLDNSVFYLDDKRIVRRLEAYNPVRVSTGPIDAALWECAPNEIAAAYGMTLEWNSHKVYILTVPGRFSFAYDVWSKEWTRFSTNGQPHFAVTDLTLWNGLWVAGDSRSGKLYVLDWDYILDGHEELERELVSPCLAENQNPVTVNEVEFLFGPGGPVTVPVNFPDQPEGPSISGDAPEGSVGEDYSFSYTVTGGTGAKRVTLRSGTLPPGLTLSQTGVLSGAPTEYGSFSFVVRATDENGLFDDLADHIPVVLPMILSANFGVSSIYIIPSAGGVDWSAASINSSSDNKSGLLGIEGGRYFSNGLASVTPARYSDDGGHTWTNTVANVVMGIGMCYAEGRLLLGAHSSGMRVSIDRGETFSTSVYTAGRVVNLEYNSPVVCALEGGSQGANVYHSTDAGVTFGTSIPHGLNYTTGGMLGTDGVDFYLGAQIGGNPVLKKYTVGGVLSTETLPTLSAGFVIAFGANEDIKVFATNTGQICVNEGSGWELLTDAFAHACNQIFWNGAVFIAPTGASAAPGAMYTSSSGRTWTISPMAGAYTPNTVAQKAPDV